MIPINIQSREERRRQAFGIQGLEQLAGQVGLGSYLPLKILSHWGCMLELCTTVTGPTIPSVTSATLGSHQIPVSLQEGP